MDAKKTLGPIKKKLAISSEEIGFKIPNIYIEDRDSLTERLMVAANKSANQELNSEEPKGLGMKDYIRITIIHRKFIDLVMNEVVKKISDPNTTDEELEKISQKYGFSSVEKIKEMREQLRISSDSPEKSTARVYQKIDNRR